MHGERGGVWIAVDPAERILAHQQRDRRHGIRARCSRMHHGDGGPLRRRTSVPRIDHMFAALGESGGCNAAIAHLERRNDRTSILLAIVIKSDQRHIGNIKLGSINWIHRLADMGILIGEKDCWGKGYATEAIRLVAGYAFEILNLHKLVAGVYSMNEGSSRAFLKAGFMREGAFKEHYFCEGRYVDSEMLGLLAPRYVAKSRQSATRDIGAIVNSPNA